MPGRRRAASCGREAEAGEAARPVALQEHVRAAQQLRHRRGVGGVAQVEHARNACRGRYR